MSLMDMSQHPDLYIRAAYDYVRGLRHAQEIVDSVEWRLDRGYSRRVVLLLAPVRLSAFAQVGAGETHSEAEIDDAGADLILDYVYACREVRAVQVRLLGAQ